MISTPRSFVETFYKAAAIINISKLIIMPQPFWKKKRKKNKEKKNEKKNSLQSYYKVLFDKYKLFYMSSFF